MENHPHECYSICAEDRRHYPQAQFDFQAGSHVYSSLFLLKLTTFALLRNSVSKVEISSIETWYKYDSGYETFSS